MGCSFDEKKSCPVRRFFRVHTYLRFFMGMFQIAKIAHIGLTASQHTLFNIAILSSCWHRINCSLFLTACAAATCMWCLLATFPSINVNQIISSVVQVRSVLRENCRKGIMVCDVWNWKENGKTMTIKTQWKTWIQWFSSVEWFCRPSQVFSPTGKYLFLIFLINHLLFLLFLSKLWEIFGNSPILAFSWSRLVYIFKNWNYFWCKDTAPAMYYPSHCDDV